MSVPSKSMTYYLKGGEIVEAAVTSSPLEISARKLKMLGVQVFRGSMGAVSGQICVEPDKFPDLDNVTVERWQRFSVVSDDKLQIMAPSPLARCRPVSFLDAQSHDDLEDRIIRRWGEVVEQTLATLERARGLAADAKLRLDPWRVEGTVHIGGQAVQLLFSSAGDRACICGLGGRPLTLQPVGPRIVIPVDNDGPIESREGLWRAAVAQAQTCVGTRPEPIKDEVSLSIDLVSQDLASSYGTDVADPRVVTGFKSNPPPRMPPPRPAPVAVARTRPVAAPPAPPAFMTPAPPQVGPPLDNDSIDLLSLDLSGDLASLDLDLPD